MQDSCSLVPLRRERLQWLDALRGFTMLLVVAYHVAQFAFSQNEKTSCSLPFLVLMRMPLFFFVSGFLAHRVHFLWTLENVASTLWKKVQIQVLPALVFLGIFIVLRRSGAFWDNFVDVMQRGTKGGYWFTWVLLQMFVIYYLVIGCCRERWRGWATFVLWILSVGIYATIYMPKVFTYHKDLFFQYSSLIQTMKFMQFFLFGNLVHRYWNQVQRLFDTAWFFPLVCTLAFFCCADIFRWHTLKLMWTNLPRTTAMYCLLLMVVMFFRHYAQWFDSRKWVGRTLQYVGTRTLDIYLLHFILMPTVPAIGVWLNQSRPNFVLDILLSVAFAIPVIAFCCLVSHILRISPFFRRYLFGR